MEWGSAWLWALICFREDFSFLDFERIRSIELLVIWRIGVCSNGRLVAQEFNHNSYIFRSLLPEALIWSDQWWQFPRRVTNSEFTAFLCQLKTKLPRDERVVFHVFTANPAIIGAFPTLRRLTRRHGSSDAAGVLQQPQTKSLRRFSCNVFDWFSSPWNWSRLSSTRWLWPQKNPVYLVYGTRQR